MPHFIGTDEAGYGPNLGPLTVTGTLWDVPDLKVDLYSLLDEVVTNTSGRGSDKLIVADSKKVYGGSRNLLDLELPVLAILYSMSGQIPADWLELGDMICDSRSIKSMAKQSWLFEQQRSLPAVADVDQIRRLGDQFSNCCDANKVRLRGVRCSTLFPAEFNDGIECCGNKATLLSSTTLQSVRKLLDLTDQDVAVGCDKHGGRNKYAGLIQEFVTREFVFVGRESLESSDYRFSESSRSVQFRFQAKGESFLPTALASMVSKYIREIFMELWNGFWRFEIPDIKPTKGYPQDARRFKTEIAAKQIDLGISDHSIWRNK